MSRERKLHESRAMYERAIRVIPGGSQTLSKGADQFVQGVAPTFLQRGTSADRQLQIYRETNDLTAVVDDLIKLTMENVSDTPDLSIPQATTTASTISK